MRHGSAGTGRLIGNTLPSPPSLHRTQIQGPFPELDPANFQVRGQKPGQSSVFQVMMFTEDHAQAMPSYSKTDRPALCLEFPEWIEERQLAWPMASSCDPHSHL